MPESPAARLTCFAAVAIAAICSSVGVLAEPKTTDYAPAQADNVLRQINKTRPAISMYLYHGHPGHYSQHRDGSRDWKRILGYTDPLIAIDWAGFNKTPGTKGAADLKKTVAKYQDWLDMFRVLGGNGLLHVHGVISVGRHIPYPQGWLPKGASRDEYDDRPPGATQPGRLALANPKLYSDVVDPSIEQYLGQVKDMSRAALLFLESEPGLWNDYENTRTTGNPHTIALFQQYMREFYDGDIAALNRAAGTNYTDWTDLKPSDDNWLIRIKVAHFGSYLLYGVYQSRIVDKFHETFPQIPVSTRWCEVLTPPAFDPRDSSRYDTVKTDYLGHTWYPGNPYLEGMAKHHVLLGKVTGNGSFLRNYGRPIIWGETNMWRASEEGDTENVPYIRPMNAIEMKNLVYRSLYYNLGLLTLFNWSFPNPGFPR